MRKIYSYLLLLCCLISGVFSSALLGSPFPKAKQKLNILLITIDTLRADRLSCYSREHVETPNIDGFAKRGVLFKRAFAHTSTTLPSHTNILLGTTPLYHGVHDNSNFIVQQNFLSLAEYLKQFDYATAGFVGAYPLDFRFGISQGFDLYDDDYDVRYTKADMGGERKAEIVVDRALAWLKTQTSPWFLWIHCWDPHAPYEPPEPFKSKFSDKPYEGEVAYVDHVLGKLFGYLDSNELWEESMVVFTGDHGESLWEHDEETHGFFAYNSALWIPLVIQTPGVKPREVQHYVSHVDIFPTVCDILDIEKPAFLQGTSLLPALKGKKLRKRPIYFESMYPYYSRGWAPLRGYIYDDEKFIDSPLSEFYDLNRDFNERNNLANDRDMTKYKKELSRIIEESSSEESSQAEHKLDRESMERLRSLGYISDNYGPVRKSYGPDHDVKVLIQYHNKSVQAMDLRGKGKVAEAIDLLKGIITERNDIGIAYKNLADIYAEQDRLNDALAVLKLGHEAVPSYYEILYTYVTSLLNVRAYDEVIAIVKSSSIQQLEIDPEIWNFLGLAYWNKGKIEEAQRAYEKSIALDRKYPIPYNNLGSLYFALFQKTNNPSMYNKALESFHKAVELDPFYDTAYRGLGITYLGTEKYEEAMNCFTKVLELKPDDAQAMFYLGFSHLRKGDRTSACKYFHAVKTSPSYHLLAPGEKARLDQWIQECPPAKR